LQDEIALGGAVLLASILYGGVVVLFRRALPFKEAAA